MAKLSSETKANLQNLSEKFLEIMDEAKKSEFLLLEAYGETHQTMMTLDELTEITQQSNDLYAQISTLRIRIAEAQPILSPDMLRLLIERITLIQNRVPALERSLMEIKLDWRLL